MAALPSPTQVAGSHTALYEAYWNQVDPNGTGTVGAIAAARFLKRSGLSDVVLSRVWDLSDPAGRGCLDKAGLFVALKLVALAQAGRDLNMVNISLEMSPPKMGDPPPKLLPPTKPPPPLGAPGGRMGGPPNNVPPISAPLITALSPSTGDWSIKPTERAKYDQLFDSLQPLNGVIPGNKVKGVLMDSKLPFDTLGKIWDLADMDKDGALDRHEFVVAMHLVYKALEKYTIPASLPPELMPPSKRRSSTPLGAPLNVAPPMTAATPLVAAEAPSQPAPAVPWVVSSEDKVKYDTMFIKADIDRDGFVSGLEIKDVFLQSGVPQPVLAHIWALCDIKQTGKLNGEQFALAMWMVNRKLQGVDPPGALAPDMVPPSMRQQTAEGLTEATTTATPYSNPELDMISKDIEELAKEKLALETDIAQKEADIKIKGGEIKSLQSELDTLSAALKQLENQKGEAQKRLNDLKSQSIVVDKELADLDEQIEIAQDKVDKLRVQADEQEVTLRSQEGDVARRREQLEGLRQEQTRLEAQRAEQSQKLDSLANTLAASQLQISQAKAKITQLEEQQRQMVDAISACDSAITTGDPSLVADTSLRISPEFRDPEFTRIAPLSNGTANQNTSNTKDPFSNQNGHRGSSGFDEDPFKSDPFKSTNANDAFSSNDPFAAAFPNKAADGFDSDPFGSSFGNTAPAAKADPFDPFGDKMKNASKSPAEVDKDPFGCDPFAILHAPTRDGGPPGRPTSPSPALPPKKGKTPPPRPAPPRPMQGPTGRTPTPHSTSTTPDPFSAAHNAADPFGGSTGGFADFADFDAKFSKQSTTVPSQSLQPPTISRPAPKRMDFTDDPFRDYRYEDPFNIADPFDDDDGTAADKKNDGKPDAFGYDSSTVFSVDFEKDIKTAKAVDVVEKGGRLSVPLRQDPFASSTNGRLSAPLSEGRARLPSENQQLAWAAAESVRLEEERKRKRQQEQADFEYALALSKAEGKS